MEKLDFIDRIKVWTHFCLLFCLKRIPSVKIRLSQVKIVVMNKIHKYCLGFEILFIFLIKAEESNITSLVYDKKNKKKTKAQMQDD